MGTPFQPTRSGPTLALNEFCNSARPQMGTSHFFSKELDLTVKFSPTRLTFHSQNGECLTEGVNMKYDALVVLGAVMEWDPYRQMWDFPPIIERYAGKLVLGKVRAFVAMLLQDTAPLILVTGGNDKHPETGETCSRSVELARLITKVYGVPEEKVVPMGTIGASHTLGNAQNFVEYLRANREIIRRNIIGIVAPDFQWRRAAMMFRANPYFQQHQIRLEWIIAEQVIQNSFPEISGFFDWLYSSEAAAICTQMEIKGMRDLVIGSYQPKT